jgi:ParB-like chromosome segregation protein Spo0J
MVEAATLLERVAEAAGGAREKTLSEEALEHVRSALLEVDAEIDRLCRRHGVASSGDIDEKYMRGTLDEEDSWRVFFRLSHLEEVREALEKLVEEPLSNRKSAYRLICRIAEREYRDIVMGTSFDYEKAMVFLKDGSFLEVWLYRSESLMEKYAFHWDKTSVDGKVFRHDNMPHVKWGSVETFPKHFHQGAEWSVVESLIPENPTSAAKYFLSFARSLLRS